jgi:hypothetical protein
MASFNKDLNDHIGKEARRRVEGNKLNDPRRDFFWIARQWNLLAPHSRYSTFEVRRMTKSLPHPALS